MSPQHKGLQPVKEHDASGRAAMQQQPYNMAGFRECPAQQDSSKSPENAQHCRFCCGQQLESHADAAEHVLLNAEGVTPHEAAKVSKERRVRHSSRAAQVCMGLCHTGSGALHTIIRAAWWLLDLCGGGLAGAGQGVGGHGGLHWEVGGGSGHRRAAGGRPGGPAGHADSHHGCPPQVSTGQVCKAALMPGQCSNALTAPPGGHHIWLCAQYLYIYGRH